MSKPAVFGHENVTVYRTEIGGDQAQLVVAPSAPAPTAVLARAAYEQLAAAMRGSGMEIVQERIFAPLSSRQAVLSARANAMPNLAGRPVTFIEGRSVQGFGLAGLQIHAVRMNGGEAGTWTIHDAAGAPAGRGWQIGDTKFLLLHDVHGWDSATPNAPSPQQAKLMFHRAGSLLASQGMDYRSVVRTWIYLRDLLSWYDQFNEVRNDCYSAFGLMSGRPADIHGRISLPASTGIEGRNSAGSACAMDILALAGRATVTQMTNGRQQDAFKYGSAFSRGAAIELGDVRIIQISGTASIDQDGKSLHIGDVRAQIQQTFDVVEALLSQQAAGLEDICSATVFLKRPGDLDIYRRESARRGLSDLPAVLVNADVCREDLLFEIDGVASRP